HADDWVERPRSRLSNRLHRMAPARGLLVALYAVVTFTVAIGIGMTLGREIFPTAGAHQFQLRFRGPAGTKFESTERLAVDVLDEIKQAAGAGNIEDRKSTRLNSSHVKISYAVFCLKKKKKKIEKKTKSTNNTSRYKVTA